MSKAIPNLTPVAPGDIVTRNAHGVFRCSTARLDRAIASHLPASPAELRARIQDRTPEDYSDVLDVSALLMILVEIDGSDR